MALIAAMLDDNDDPMDISNIPELDINPDEIMELQLQEKQDAEPYDQFEGDDPDDESSKPHAAQTISEKRQLQNAIFNDYVRDAAKKIAKESQVEETRHKKDEELSIGSILAKQQTSFIKDPREYQIELFDRAKSENVIAVLDTGSGKTLIAVLLLKHVLEKEMQDREDGLAPRISFFLVPSVALVFQQHSVLDCNLPHQISRRYGSMGTDGLEKKAWEKHLGSDMVIVCTAEILHQCLIHSFVKMEQINLLVFDEAHHAKNNHPYAKIIRDFYVAAESSTQRPRIFGMTASPVNAKVNIVDAARELEDLLQCKIATFPISDEYKNKAKEVIAYYPRLKDAFETPLYQKLYTEFGGMPTFEKLFKTAKDASRNIGAWGSDQFWSFALKDEQMKKAEAKVVREYNQHPGEKSVEDHNNDMELLRCAASVVSNHRFRAPTATKADLSDKVRVLNAILQMHYEEPTDGRCIIFCTRRSTARLLYEIFLAIGGDNLRPGLLTGLSKTMGALSLSFREQVLTLKQFRAGEKNCLFATSVAEEGLDIPDCNLVIRFDLYRTMIEYIQSKGRARHVNSKFIDLLEKDNLGHRQAFADARKGTEAMRTWCDDLPADRVIGSNDVPLPEDELIGRRYQTGIGAKLTYNAALGVLDLFTSRLSYRDNVLPPRPHYIASVEAGQYVYEVVLPETSPIRSIRGRRYRRKMVAKQSAAFEMILALIAKKEIDENLLSIHKKIAPIHANASIGMSDKKGNKYPVRMKPSLWEQGRGTLPAEVYLTILDVSDGLDRPYQPLGLVTRAKLPDFPQFPIFLNTGRVTQVITKTLNRALHVDEQCIDHMTVFTHRFWKDVNNKIFEVDGAKMSYWVVPINPTITPTLIPERPTECIDWEAIVLVNQCEEMAWTPDMPNDFLEGKFVVDRESGGGRFFFVRHEPSLTPLDPVPAGVVKPWGPGGKTRKDILDYSNSLWGKGRAYMRTLWKIDQPVFEAEMIILHQNMLAEPPPKGKKEGERITKAYLCPEPMRISALPPTAVAMWLLFPAIIHRLEEYLISLEACSIANVKITPALALEALTKDSDNSGDHNEEKINFRPGMGNNYERLEFIGDCFLKMATSISLFGHFPDDNEFDYHVKRMLMLCNKNLFQTALSEDMKLAEYVRSLAFDRATWYPDNLVMLKGKGQRNRGQEHEQRLGDKTVADICESFIGAAFVQYDQPGQPWTPEMWTPAVHAVTTFVRSEDHTMTKWSDYLKNYKIPAYQVAEVTAAQADMAAQIEEAHPYHFNYPRLLRSAFSHPSHPYSWELIPSYQRLEFLGDSLLDTACVTYLFYKYPDKDPQWLTEHKMAMVANKFLGALCVKLGFHRHLKHSHAQVQFGIQQYVSEVQDAMETSGGAVDYWIGVKDPPKCLPDMVESYIGAIFVDSSFNYQPVQSFFDTHILPFFTDMTLYDTFANNHPTTHLHNLLSINLGCSDYRLFSRELPLESVGCKPRVMSALMIHDKVVVDAVRESSRYAKTAASKKALDLLEGLAPFEFRGRFGCDCKQKDGEEDVAMGNGGKDGEERREMGVKVVDLGTAV